MFRVIDKDTHESFDVYDITYDKNGYPHFLVYLGNEWIRLSAKHFSPSFEDLEQQYEIDSRPSRWTKAWQELREYIEKNNIDCSTEDVMYDFYTCGF